MDHGGSGGKQKRWHIYKKEPQIQRVDIEKQMNNL